MTARGTLAPMARVSRLVGGGGGGGREGGRDGERGLLRENV